VERLRLLLRLPDRLWLPERLPSLLSPSRLSRPRHPVLAHLLSRLALRLLHRLNRLLLLRLPQRMKAALVVMPDLFMSIPR
jgi:hypothetical protein